MSSKYAWIVALATIGGFIVGFTLIYQLAPTNQTPPKQPVDNERYYCHETGFLMHHWQHGDKSRWEDTMERNQFEDPVKCELR